MVTSHSPAIPGTPVQIYVIRQGEKPADPLPGKHAQPSSPPFGVDVDGNQNAHSLLPRGWQRSGALTVLFDPTIGALQAGLRTPTALYSTSYADPDNTQNHRTYQTIQALSERLDVFIQSPVPEGQEPALAAAVLASGGGVVLICWEHQHIPAMAQAIPALDATTIPSAWPGDRFDVIWTFTLDPATGRYVFGQVPQQLCSATPTRSFSDHDTGKVS